jgi:hypothetical protein
LTSKKPLQGVELISCAKANAKYGEASAAKQCGYGENVETFLNSLKQACDEAGLAVNQVSDLMTTEEIAHDRGTVEISPRTLDDAL